MIQRQLFTLARERLRKRPAVAILGARQVGKTTLAHQLAENLGVDTLWLDLETPQSRALLQQPYDFLPRHAEKLVVIDEVQRMPDVFQALRVLIDKDRRPGRFLLLGSSSPAIVRQAAESLAGRISYLDLFPFSLNEVGYKEQARLWLRGGYPEAFLATGEGDAFLFLDDLLRSFIERDLVELGLGAAPENTFNLLRMVASMHGQPLNLSMLAKSIGMSVPTVKVYLEFFVQACMAFKLPSFHLNTRKRLTKTPKIYITDSGVLHALNGIRDGDRLLGQAIKGHSWEGFVVQQVRARLEHRAELHYFRTADGAEVDLVISQGNRPIAAVEIKSTDHPVLSKGNHIALETVGAPLQLVVTPSALDHAMGDQVQVCSLATMWGHLEEALR